MVITNKFNLPQSLVNAVSTEKHNEPGCYSATTLLKGAKEIFLTDRHWNEIEVDVSDLVWALFGTAVHKLLEEANPNAFTEERFNQNVNGVNVTGQVDLYDMEEKTITDYKTASVWKVIFQNFDDWKKQGFIYAWLLKKEGLEVKRCRFIAMLRDWTMGEAQKKADYPQSQIYEYTFDVTEEDLSDIEKYIESKVEEIKANDMLLDDDIPPCTEEERWARPATYAVMKEGRKTAVKVCDTQEDADEYAKTVDKSHVEKREGKNVKCEGYCHCKDFCNFYKTNCVKE